MSELSMITKCLWQREVMESCYKLYTWVHHTMLMLLVQIFWKMSQISDYFNKNKGVEEAMTEKTFVFQPFSQEFKMRRHIRSMSDVQSSMPYRIAFRSRKGSTQTLMYDSDTRARRIRAYNRHLESSDSSDNSEPRKVRSLERNILKHTDSMRIL